MFAKIILSALCALMLVGCSGNYSNKPSLNNRDGIDFGITAKYSGGDYRCPNGTFLFRETTNKKAVMVAARAYGASFLTIRRDILNGSPAAIEAVKTLSLHACALAAQAQASGEGFEAMITSGTNFNVFASPSATQQQWTPAQPTIIAPPAPAPQVTPKAKPAPTEATPAPEKPTKKQLSEEEILKVKEKLKKELEEKKKREAPPVEAEKRDYKKPDRVIPGFNFFPEDGIIPVKGVKI